MKEKIVRRYFFEVAHEVLLEKVLNPKLIFENELEQCLWFAPIPFRDEEFHNPEDRQKLFCLADVDNFGELESTPERLSEEEAIEFILDYFPIPKEIHEVLEKELRDKLAKAK